MDQLVPDGQPGIQKGQEGAENRCGQEGPHEEEDEGTRERGGQYAARRHAAEGAEGEGGSGADGGEGGGEGLDEGRREPPEKILPAGRKEDETQHGRVGEDEGEASGIGGLQGETEAEDEGENGKTSLGPVRPRENDGAQGHEAGSQKGWARACEPGKE